MKAIFRGVPRVEDLGRLLKSLEPTSETCAHASGGPGVLRPFQFPSQRSGDLVSNAGAHGGDQSILVFGKWALLKAEGVEFLPANLIRSEERRVGKECRSRWSPYH